MSVRYRRRSAVTFTAEQLDHGQSQSWRQNLALGLNGIFHLCSHSHDCRYLFEGADRCLSDILIEMAYFL